MLKHLDRAFRDAGAGARHLMPVRQRSNEPALAQYSIRELAMPTGQQWAPASYAEYYAKSVPVYRAVKLRADAVASARLKVYLPNADDDLEWVGEDHPVQVFLDHVNAWWSAPDIWRGVETYASLWGSSFRWVNKVTSDIATWEMWLLRPDKTAVVRDRQKYIRGFIYDPYGANFPMLPEEVLWDHYFNPLDEFGGFSPIVPGRLAIEMQLDMLRANRTVFQRGINTSNLAFLMEGPLQQFQIDAFYKRLDDRHGGPDKSGRPIVMDTGQGKVQNLGFSNRDMEYMSGIRLTKEMVSDIFGVPEELLAGSQHSTFANRAEARRDFYSATITNEWIWLQASMQERVVPMLPEQYRDVILRFDLTEVSALQEAIDARADRDRLDVQAGIITVNEVREGRGLEPVPWGDEPPSPAPAPGPDAAPDDGPPDEGQSLLRAHGWSRGVTAPAALFGLYARKQRDRQDAEQAVEDLDLYQDFIRQLDPLEQDFREVQLRLFDEQMRAVNEAIRKAGSIEPAAAGAALTPDEWLPRYRELGRPPMENGLGKAAAGQVKRFTLGIAFDLQAPVVQSWLDERVVWWAGRVNEGTAADLVATIQEALANGESIRKTQDRIHELFEFYSELRTETIARTEMAAATNNGHLNAYRQANAGGKRWLSALLGDRTRAEHAAAHRQVVEVDQPFSVGGELLMHPGDQNGSAGNTINCLCTLAPVVRR